MEAASTTAVAILARRASPWPRRLAAALAADGSYDVMIFVDGPDPAATDTPRCDAPMGYSVVFVPDVTCRAAGITGSCQSMMPKRPIVAWDRAIAALSRPESRYERVWFIEEDAFLASAAPLRLVDGLHPGADLIAKDYAPRSDIAGGGWIHWKDSVRYQHHRHLAVAHSFVPVCMVSRRVLRWVAEFGAAAGTIPFLEIAFASAAAALNGEVVTPPALAHVWMACRPSSVPRDDAAVLAHPHLVFHPIKSEERLLRLMDASASAEGRPA